ncbi:MAG: hypothetical protein PVG39_00800 [Desulfobacteraceae bacterium]|jgi:hypothetical protein
MKFAVKQSSPTEIAGLGRDPLPDEYGGESDVITDMVDEYYFVSWDGTPGEGQPTVSRKSQAEIDAIEAAKAQAAADEQTRVEEIETAQQTAGLKSYTITQAETYIDNQLDAASTVAETKEAMKTILKKMIPYLLK